MAPTLVCRKRPFATHTEWLRPRLEGGGSQLIRERTQAGLTAARTQSRAVPREAGHERHERSSLWSLPNQ